MPRRRSFSSTRRPRYPPIGPYPKKFASLPNQRTHPTNHSHSNAQLQLTQKTFLTPVASDNELRRPRLKSCHEAVVRIFGPEWYVLRKGSVYSAVDSISPEHVTLSAATRGYDPAI